MGPSFRKLSLVFVILEALTVCFPLVAQQKEQSAFEQTQSKAYALISADDYLGAIKVLDSAIGRDYRLSQKQNSDLLSLRMSTARLYEQSSGKSSPPLSAKGEALEKEARRAQALKAPSVPYKDPYTPFLISIDFGSLNIPQSFGGGYSLSYGGEFRWMPSWIGIGLSFEANNKFLSNGFSSSSDTLSLTAPMKFEIKKSGTYVLTAFQLGDEFEDNIFSIGLSTEVSVPFVMYFSDGTHAPGVFFVAGAQAQYYFSSGKNDLYRMNSEGIHTGFSFLFPFFKMNLYYQANFAYNFGDAHTPAPQLVTFSLALAF